VAEQGNKSVEQGRKSAEEAVSGATAAGTGTARCGTAQLLRAERLNAYNAKQSKIVMNPSRQSSKLPRHCPFEEGPFG